MLTVIVDTVTNDHLTTIGEYRTVHKPGTVILRVVVALLRVNRTLTGSDMRRTHDMGHRKIGIVIKGISGEEEFRTLHLHVIVED